jgi:hypothetical protein
MLKIYTLGFLLTNLTKKQYQFRTLEARSWNSEGLGKGYTVGSSDFDIFLEIQYASCVFGLALKS